MISELIIDQKKYVVIPKDDYDSLLKSELLKKYEGQLYSLEEAKKRSEELILQWAKRK